jgi:hypothetical protein
MKSTSNSKSALALVLAIVLITSACSAQWINVALQDLPVLTQMALNLANLAAVLASGKQASSGDVAVIENISAQASRDLNLLQSLYSQYKTSPSSSGLQRIQSVIADLNANLPTLMQSAHISNPILSVRVAAAVGLILSTVSSFAALIPQTAAATARTISPPSIPGAQELRRQWNRQVCSQTGNPALDDALAQSVLQ